MTNIHVYSMNDTLGLCEEKDWRCFWYMQTRFKEVLDIPPVSPDGDAIGKQTGNVTESKTSPSREQVSGSLMSKALKG